MASLQVARRAWTFRFPSGGFYRDYFRTYYGPTLKAFAALGAADQARLAAEIEALVARFNCSGDETMIVPADYLEVVAVRA